MVENHEESNQKSIIFLIENSKKIDASTGYSHYLSRRRKERRGRRVRRGKEEEEEKENFSPPKPPIYISKALTRVQ